MRAEAIVLDGTNRAVASRSAIVENSSEVAPNRFHVVAWNVYNVPNRAFFVRDITCARNSSGGWNRYGSFPTPIHTTSRP
jgi:hypothetical protein